MKPEIRFGFGVVESFNHEKRNGLVKFADEPVRATLTYKNQCAMAPGVRQAEFSSFSSEKRLPLHGGVAIACVYVVGYVWEEKECRHYLQRTLRRTVVIERWDWKTNFDAIEAAIAARPKYEFVDFVFYRGSPLSTNQRRVILTGTALEVQERYPRGAKNDYLAPEARIMDLFFRRRWYLNGRQVPDPRPLPLGTAPEPFQPTNEQGELLATATEVLGFVQVRNGFGKNLAVA